MKDKKIKLKKVLLIIFIILCVISLSVSLFNIIKWKIDSDKTNKQINKLQDTIEINETIDNDKTEIIEQEEIDEHNPYWDYIKMNMINVDFTELQNINPDTVGWLQVNGTNINYPFVQTTNNKFYLNHSFDKMYNEGGWVFLDYRNSIDNLQKNNIIYAHGRLDNTMFGSLRKILKKEWLNNTNNHVIKISTKYENTLWQVFSIYHIPTTNDYIRTEFNSNESFLKFGNMLLKRSKYNFNTTISENDIILTLSTCYDDYEKMVLHAKLIKKEKK